MGREIFKSINSRRKMPVKIIELTNDFSFGNGRSEVINNLSSELRKYFDVEIIYTSSLNNPPKTIVRVSKMNSKQILKKLLSIKEKTIVHSHFGKNQIIAAISGVLNKNIIHVITDYVNPPRKIVNLNLKEYFKVEAFEWVIYHLRVDKIIGISDYSCNLLKKKYRAKKNKIVKIFCGVDLKKYFRLPKKEREKFLKKNKIDPKKTIIGCFSRFSGSKNIDILIEFAKKFPKDVILFLGGAIDQDPSYYLKCKKISKNMNNVKIITNLEDNEKRLFINSIDIFAYPSLWEGFGLPIIETMACGKPVICFNRFGMKELVKSNYNGFAVKSEGEFLNKIKLLSKNNQLKEKLGKNAREFSKKFDWESLALEYKKLFESLLK